ncbi:MAG: hypothetical protein ABL994_03645 [Verrucomicrobiales bacterium]
MSLFVLRRGTAEVGERKHGMTVEWRDPSEAVEDSRQHPERYASAFKQVFWRQEWRSVHAFGQVEKALNKAGAIREQAIQNAKEEEERPEGSRGYCNLMGLDA